MGLDSRRSPRYPFYASAEITELQTKTAVTARTSELSRHGCYMDMMNPFPLATRVKIQITHQDEIFEATGSVIYAQPNMGMGVSFEVAQPKEEATLEKWLQELQAKQN
jgi:PilZ domain